MKSNIKSQFRGFPESIELVDKLYRNLGGDLNEITVLATSQAGTSFASKGPPTSGQLDGKSWPLFLAKQIGKGRVSGLIPGHNLFTFNDAHPDVVVNGDWAYLFYFTQFTRRFMLYSWTRNCIRFTKTIVPIAG